MTSKVLYKITLILLCSLIPAMHSCKQNAKKEMSEEQKKSVGRNETVQDYV